MNSITVKVIRAPGLVLDVSLPAGATVADALAAANTSLMENETPEINGRAGSLTTTLNHNDAVIMAKGAKGAVRSVQVTDMTYIDGTPVEGMSVDTFLDYIATVDGEIKRLKNADVDSPVLTKHIKQLKKTRKLIVELMEIQHGGDDESED